MFSKTLLITVILLSISFPQEKDKIETLKRKSFLTNEVEEAINNGLEFLKNKQNKDGSFGSGVYPVGETSIAVLAFLVNGHLPGKGKYGEVVKKGIDFILSKRDPVSGYISSGSMYEHGFAMLVLADVYGEYKHPELKDILEKGVELIVKAQYKNGGWRYQPRPYDADLSVSSCIIQALRAAREAFIYVPKETIEKAIKFVKSCSSSGEFYYKNYQEDSKDRKKRRIAEEHTSTALLGAGVLSLMALGEYDAKETQQGLASLFRVRNIEYSNHPGYTAYYCVQAMYQAGGKYWEEWYPKIQKSLLAMLKRSSSSQYEVIEKGFTIIALSFSKGLMPLFAR